MSRTNPNQLPIIGIHTSPWLPLRGTYEVHLEYVKKYRRSWAVPRCYLSHLPEQAALAKKLGHDLRDAGVIVLEQAADVVELSDFVIMLDTPVYEREFQCYAPALAADVYLVKARLREVARLTALGKESQLTKGRLIALALEGGNESHGFPDCKPGRFYDETHYPVGLFDLVLNLYSLPLTHAGFAPLRQALHAQWEQTLAGHALTRADERGSTPLKVFISYSHKDEPFKTDLLTVLDPLVRRGVLKIWHDRMIEEGDEWRREIEAAMRECDMALLFVSKNFLASPFIQDDELPPLLQRRKEEGLRVVPIIIGPCMWQVEPVLRDLQAVPKDGKPVITFKKNTGARDRVWADIAAVIERRAKEKAAT